MNEAKQNHFNGSLASFVRPLSAFFISEHKTVEYGSDFQLLTLRTQFFCNKPLDKKLPYESKDSGNAVLYFIKHAELGITFF